MNPATQEEFAIALAKAAYEDRPPLGRRPVPWTRGIRQDWEDWARRIAVDLHHAEIEVEFNGGRIETYRVDP